MASRDERKTVGLEFQECLMIIVLVALSVSVLLGLATGLVFRVWTNVIVGPLIAFGSALGLASHGFGLLEGVLVTFGCVFVSQLAYLIGSFLVSPASIAHYLVDDVPDNQPGDNREHDIAGEQEQERPEDPPRPPPFET
jgi:large-conductance mechanosensitive channel